MNAPTKKLTLFSFFAMTASMVITVYEYPAFATSGLKLVFFLLICGFFWFIPLALVAAEMATVKGWQKGGLFTWVERTLGSKWGFLAVFYQWFQVTVNFVTMIYFIIGALSIALDWHALNDDIALKLTAILVIFWLITFSQFWGTTWTAKIAKIGFLVGVLGAGILLFILAFVYIAKGGSVLVSFDYTNDWIPNFSQISTLVIFVSFVLAYAGVESSASHVNEMKNPKRDYPLAIFLLVLVAIVFDILGGFSIAATIPPDQIGLNTGVIQAFRFFIVEQFGGGAWLVSVIAILICFGVIAEVACWVVGPSYAILRAAEEGLLPKSLAKTNNAKVPVRLVIIQGIVFSIWATVLTFGGGNSNISFFIAMALTVCTYLSAYILMFVGYLVLASKHPEYERAFKIPGGKVGKMTVALIGLIITLFTLFIAFIAPSGIGNISGLQYFLILFICWIIMIITPFFIYQFYGKKHYVQQNETDVSES